MKFFAQLLNSIDEVYANQIEEIEPLKSAVVIKNVKDALKDQLKIAASIAIAPNAINNAKKRIETITESSNLIDRNVLSEVFENAKDIRNANMFNNHLSSFPLISYISATIDKNYSFVSAQPQDIVHLSKHQSGDINLDDHKIQLCPRFVHFDEICQLYFLTSFYEGGNPVSKHINEGINEF